MKRSKFALFGGAVVAAALVVSALGFQAKEDTMALKGQAAPEVELKTLDGKDFKLSELKGSVVVMDYWATWCPPCRKGLPHINEMAKDPELASKGVKVFAINSKETKEKAKQYVEENKLTFSVPLDPDGKFGKAYKVRGIPTTVIVGRDGKVAEVFIGFGDGSEAKIKEAVLKAAAASTTTGE